jgi:hypothetical protein
MPADARNVRLLRLLMLEMLSGIGEQSVKGIGHEVDPFCVVPLLGMRINLVFGTILRRAK